MLRRRHYEEEKTAGKAEVRKKETQADRKDRNTSRGIPRGFEDLTNTENQWRRVGSNHRQVPNDAIFYLFP